MNIRFARVVATHPSRRTVDLVFLDTGYRCGDVPVLASVLGTDCGVWSVPDAPKPATESEAGGIAPTGRTVLAACGFVQDRPIVLGFVQPDGGQMAFDEQNRTVYRHPSGSYVTVAPDGSIEAYHSGGGYVRIGSGDHEDLGGKAADGNWSLPGNNAPTITVATAGVKATIRPDGTATLHADTSVTIDTPTTHVTGTLTVDGMLTFKGGMTGSGGSGSTATIEGNVVVSSGNVTADGIGLKTHKHTDPQGGNVSAPIP